MADKITPKDVAEKKDEFVLIDVREADEVAEDGTIEEAVNIPLGELIRKGRQGELDDLKGKTICTYCNGGYRGNIGADELNKKGFTAVTVDGGYAAWKEEKKKIPDQANRNSAIPCYDNTNQLSLSLPIWDNPRVYSKMCYSRIIQSRKL